MPEWVMHEKRGDEVAIAVTLDDDPVAWLVVHQFGASACAELTAEMARELGAELIATADRLDAHKAARELPIATRQRLQAEGTGGAS